MKLINKLEAPEISDFNMKIRDCILITKENIHAIAGDFVATDFNDSSIVIFRTDDLRRKYHLNCKDRNKWYAVGISLGYPPKCVDWWDSAPRGSNKEIALSPAVHKGSLTFKTPPELLSYAIEFLYNDKRSTDDIRISYSNWREE